MEYMVIVGFVMLALLGGSYLFYTQISGQSFTAIEAQAVRMGNLIIETVERLHFLGGQSRTTLEVSYPAGLVNLSVRGSELVIAYRSPSGVTERAFPSRTRIALSAKSLSQGERSVVLQSTGREISICAIEKQCDCDGICGASENATHCPADCCSDSDNVNLPAAWWEGCVACQPPGSLTPYTCAVAPQRRYLACDGHRGCVCANVTSPPGIPCS